MRFADYRLKSIQEAVQTAPQGHVDMSHLEGGGYEAPPEADANYQQAMAKATAWENSQKSDDSNDENED